MKRGIAILAVAFCAACDAGQMTDVTPDKETLFLTEACYDPDDSHCVNEYPLWDDPDPTADGYYIGAYTLQDCLWLGIWGDADVDGFDDKCEYRLAHTFAPQLALHGSELDASRETYWAATYFPNDGLYGAGGYVRILYLLGYHWDMGADNCNGCNNHPGDSEWIALDIVFDSLSQHWQFAGVRTSAHGSYNISYPGDVEYPHRVGGYPRIW